MVLGGTRHLKMMLSILVMFCILSCDAQHPSDAPHPCLLADGGLGWERGGC